MQDKLQKETLTRTKREDKVKNWFAMWLDKSSAGIEEIFADDVVYTESWGPRYCGIAAVKEWFAEWNSRCAVRRWNTGRFFHFRDTTIVEWDFACTEADGSETAFDGVSIIEWTDDKISTLTEYGCSTDNYNPYADGTGVPVFRLKEHGWF